MTVKTFIEKHPDASLVVMTPGGYAALNPGEARAALEGGTVTMNSGVIGNEYTRRESAEHLLSQAIVSVGLHEDHVWNMLTAEARHRERLLAEDAPAEDRLAARVEDDWEEYQAELEMLTPRELVACADEIAATKEIYGELSKGAGYEDYADWLLESDQPLRKVAKLWQETSWVDFHELENLLGEQMQEESETLSQGISM